ncbi:carbon-nitrogen hydrolase family protein [Bdellovibrio sp. HCB337]|uniref:carbon-nitrogen hydrolase family protein n=1 Tax=Bdellovibrio sp. HCB337 TaxID=3394358 RepID=UPI0039A6FE32
MSQELKVALCQMTSVDSVNANLKQIESLLAEVPENAGVRLYCFPENCLYLRVNEGEAVPPFNLTDKVFADLAVLARKRKAYFHLGSVPLQMGDFLYNSSVIISDEGHIETSYQKIHLFDIQLSGQKPIRESDVFRHGEGPGIFELDGWKIAQSICYDLRFAELYSQYAKEHVDVILVPAAFLVKTGEAHWEVLLRARAIESQCYVVASAQAGLHTSTHSTGQRSTYGNSMVVEPWGQMAVRLDGTEKQTSVCSLSKAKIEQMRTQIPMAQHRRVTVK